MVRGTFRPSGVRVRREPAEHGHTFWHPRREADWASRKSDIQPDKSLLDELRVLYRGTILPRLDLQ